MIRRRFLRSLSGLGTALLLSFSIPLVAATNKDQAAANAQLDEQKRADILSIMRKHQAEDRIPALAVSVISNGKIVFSEAVGFQRQGQSASNATRFHSASISKLITATAIMQLSEAGKLRLDEALGDILPAFEGSVITIRQLLSHTAGFSNRTRPKGETSHDAIQPYLKRVANQKPAYEPGQNWKYNDVDYNILGAVITAKSGLSFEEYLAKHIFGPLQMNQSTGILSEVAPLNLAMGHCGKSAKSCKRHPYDIVFAPSSGVQTTVGDLSIFLRAHMQKEAVLLAPTCYEMMQTPLHKTKWDGIEQGLGWQVITSKDGVKTIQHGGSDKGFRALVLGKPQNGWGIVVLSNGERTQRWVITSEIEEVFQR